MFLLLIILTHLILLSNFQFTLWPEMIVYPYLINNGFSLYTDIINPYPPLIPLALSLFSKYFSYQHVPYQFLTWGFIIIIDLAIFFIAKKITGSSRLALISTSFFALFSLPFGVNGLWFDLLQTPFLLFSALFFYKFLKPAKDLKNLLLSSIFLCVAFFIKQQAIWLALAFIILIILKNYHDYRSLIKKVLIYLAPFISVFLLELVITSFFGANKPFIFWTILFPFFKTSSLPGYVLFPSLRQLLTLISLYAIFTPQFKLLKSKTSFFLLNASILILFAYPRFDYFHLIPALSFLSIAFGENLSLFLKSKTPVKIIAIISLTFLVLFSVRFLQRNYHKDIRFFEKDIIQASNFLKTNTNPQDLIYIQNGPDQILPLAGRLPPKPWADEFPWYLEINYQQEKIIENLNSQKPRYLVFKPYNQGDKYEVGVYRPQKIADFLDVSFVNLAPISNTLYFKVSVLHEK